MLLSRRAALLGSICLAALRQASAQNILFSGATSLPVPEPTSGIALVQANGTDLIITYQLGGGTWGTTVVDVDQIHPYDASFLYGDINAVSSSVVTNGAFITITVTLSRTIYSSEVIILNLNAGWVTNDSKALTANAFQCGNFSVQTAPTSAPIVANQTLTFGRKTLASAGGTLPVNTGGLITGGSIDAGTNSNHWQISSGVITPSATGVAAGLSASPYSLTVTYSNGAGSVQRTITINTTALEWSVATYAELTTAGSNAGVALGDRILLRSALYNPTQDISASISRSSVPTGVWSAPTLKDATQPDQGYDLDTGTYVIITAHSGAWPVIARMRLNNVSGGVKYFRMTGLSFYRYPLGPLNDNGRASGMLALDDVTDCAADNCTFYSNLNFGQSFVGLTHSGITMAGATALCYLYDNTMHDLCTSFGGSCVGLQAIGNTVFNWWGDGITIKTSPSVTIAWNKVYGVKPVDDFIGLHQDFMQLNDGSVVADVTDLRIIGNQFWVGQPFENFVSGQGYFAGDLQSPYFYTDLVVAGNLGLFDQVNPLAVRRGKRAKYYNNTIVTNPTYPNHTLSLFTHDLSSVRFNIYQTWVDSTPITPTVFSDNVPADVTAGSGATSYGELFVDPESLGAVTDVASQYAIKDTSAAAAQALKAGAAGTGYVDYVNRTIDFPWDESGFDISGAFTDVTGAPTSTLTTSTPVQVTGISATGALNDLSGDGSPEFRITSDVGGSVVIRDWSNAYAVIQSGQYLWLRATSSGSGSTAINVTITCGTTADTWTVTTA